MENTWKGRGSQERPLNRFDRQSYVRMHEEGIDLEDEGVGKTEFTRVYPKSILNRVNSPDLPFIWSVNPYQGCEHGCVYCYARPSHEFWGFNSGIDFEQKILVKENPAALLKQALGRKGHEVSPIVISGNTDCYQPAERKYKLTQGLLTLLNKSNHPAGIITKNALVQRDLPILKEMAERNLIQVVLSITTLDEDLRRKLEPRTASVKQKLKTLETLSKAGIPTGVMMAPLIPGLTVHEIPELLKTVSSAGASHASYTLLRLNGSVREVFEAWLKLNYPDRYQKVLHQLAEVHGGEIEDFRSGKRMRGEGSLAESIKTTFHWAKQKYGLDQKVRLNTKAFIPPGGRQTKLSF